MLSEAKHLEGQDERPFAALRMTGGCQGGRETFRGVYPEPIRFAQGKLHEWAQGDTPQYLTHYFRGLDSGKLRVSHR